MRHVATFKRSMKIIHIEKIIPDAYHGTTMENARSIVQGGHFKSSRGSDVYLGDGVYFYEASKWHAFEWAKRNYAGVDLGILRAWVNLGKCLDLNNYEHRLLLKQVRRELLQRGVSEITDAVVINFYATNIEEFDTVRAPYTVSQRGMIFPGSKYHEFSQLIICVRNNKRIIKFQIIFEGKKYHA